MTSLYLRCKKIDYYLFVTKSLIIKMYDVKSNFKMLILFTIFAKNCIIIIL